MVWGAPAGLAGVVGTSLLYQGLGAHYRHTTPEMAARIATAIEQRLTVVLKVAEQALEAQPHRSTQRVL